MWLFLFFRVEFIDQIRNPHHEVKDDDCDNDTGCCTHVSVFV